MVKVLYLSGSISIAFTSIQPVYLLLYLLSCCLRHGPLGYRIKFLLKFGFIALFGVLEDPLVSVFQQARLRSLLKLFGHLLHIMQFLVNKLV